MVLLDVCTCCDLPVTCAVFGVYLLVAYTISFAIELWWILEAKEILPLPAYFLCLEYFFLFIFSALLLHGLSVKRSTCLLIWMFLLGVLIGPEAGLVLYMSIQHWRITQLYGLIEVTCWTCRLLVNVAALISVQSLYRKWSEEKSVLLRLQALNMGYQNQGFQLEQKPQEEDYLDPFFDQTKGFSEFNASTFDPNIITSRNEAKSQSLLDLRETNNEQTSNPNLPNSKTISLNYINYLGKLDGSNSLDRKFFKNKKTAKMSPFFRRKNNDEINVYQVNSNMDDKLNRVFVNRGMYFLDEKTGEVIYYPPQYFNTENKIHGSGKFSLDTNSDDIQQICDVAL